MKPSNFRHYDLNQATRKNLEVAAFGGVDYSSQKFNIGDGHAIDEKNFVYRDGVLQKRNGVEHLFNVDDFEYVIAKFDDRTVPLEEKVYSNKDTGKEINGMWHFVAEDGNEHTIAHIGCLLYEIKKFNTDFIHAEPIKFGEVTIHGVLRPLVFAFENYKSSAFVGGHKLWFLGGNKYMLIRFYNNSIHIDAVEDSELMPIPTTTIGITFNGSGVSGRQSLDDVSLLNHWRKNGLISGTKIIEGEEVTTTFYEYTLDAPIIPKKQIDYANIEMIVEESGTI